MNIKTAVRLMRAVAETSAIFDKEIKGFSVDSRTTTPGALFFALSPEDYRDHYFTATSFVDSHEFIPQAFERGAVAAVARTTRVTDNDALTPYRDRLLLVDDVILALQHLAHGVLESWGRPVVGITGSAGKTTTKDLTAHILDGAGRRVLRSRCNFNNELGVALSVLQLAWGAVSPEYFDIAVLEMGMSLPGEIARHCLVAPPDIGVVLLVAPVHLEFMRSIEGVAAGKAQMIQGINPGGIAVLNADDARVAAMRTKHTSGPTVTFGITNPADVMALDIETIGLDLTRFRLRTWHGEAEVTLPMLGHHNVMNALAASAVAACFDIEPPVIAKALASATPTRMRGEVLRFAEGFTVVDDSYNSNPCSLTTMAKAITQVGEDVKRRVVVAGEMLELGATAAAIHRQTGREIAHVGIDALWGVQGYSCELIEGAQEVGMPATATLFFETSEDAGATLADYIRPGDLVLVKGSRGARTDKVIDALRARYELK